MDRKTEARVLISLVAGLFGVVLFKTAWLCDDAFISYRVVDNFINGYGLRWNVAERVQVFTHPLWLFTLSAARMIVPDMYFAAILVSVAFSFASVVWLAFGLAESEGAALLALLFAIMSKAFVEYSTSGLENPMNFLLLAAFAWRWFKGVDTHRRAFQLFLIAGLISLNRMDAVLLCVPALALAAWRLRGWRMAGAALLGFAPLAAWMLFSLIYYGFPFPNTAYAKLNHDMPAWWVLEHGLQYHLNSLSRDPATLTAVAAALIWSISTKNIKLTALMAGALLYHAYLIKIGGDFMSGRMLTLPFFVSLIVLARARLDLRSWLLWAALAIVTLIGMTSPHPPLLSGSEFGINIHRPWDQYEIADERAEYYQRTGLLKVPIGEKFAAEWMVRFLRSTRAEEGNVVKQGTMGFMGFFGGPDMFIVDVFGITDPLLARLPARRDYPQRIGHYWRVAPEGYMETVKTGELQLRDPDLNEYYRVLHLITRGSLFRLDRLSAIVKMNLGFYDGLIDREYYMSMPYESLPLEDLQTRTPDGTDWDHEDVFVFKEDRFDVILPEPSRAPRIDVSLDSNDVYQIEYYHGETLVASGGTPAPEGVEKGMASLIVETPPEAVESGFDRVRIHVDEGDKSYSIGHFILLEDESKE